MFRKLNLLLAAATLLYASPANAYPIPGFTLTGQFQEQVRILTFDPGVTATLVAATNFNPQLPTTLILYALPNGNTTAQTMGHAPAPNDDWHFDIQHIAAQTRLLRAAYPTKNLVIAYLETAQKSWPAWRAANKDNAALIADIVAKLRAAVPSSLSPDVYLTGHSGGGGFAFSFINAADAIPAFITRIGFLDSNYDFGDDPGHDVKLLAWLHANPDNRLFVIAYDDRNIMLDGKKVVSDTGGTFRATYRMVDAFKKDWPLTEGASGSYITFTAPQVEMFINKNPANKILHTMLVGEFNGFIRAMSDMRPGPHESWEKPLASLEGPRAYTGWVERPAPIFTDRIPASTLPARAANALGGAAFMQSIAAAKSSDPASRATREAAVLSALKSGNIPAFLRNLVPITVKATDADGHEHTATYNVMPDYLAIGSDADFVRVPMNPHTAQAFCDAFGFVLPTTKMSDDIWQAAVSKLIPQPMTQAREDAPTWLTHNQMIEAQLTGQYLGELRAGHKKDIVITNLIYTRPSRLAIYGWQFPSGESIQPVTIVHVDWYVDYSHGVRPVQSTITVDGKPMSYAAVLRDPNLNVLLSKEGPIPNSTYPAEIPASAPAPTTPPTR